MAIPAENTGFVSDDAFVSAVIALDKGTVEERIAFTFELLDTGGTGAITEHELHELLKVCR